MKQRQKRRCPYVGPHKAYFLAGISQNHICILIKMASQVDGLTGLAAVVTLRSEIAGQISIYPIQTTAAGVPLSVSGR